MAHIVIIVKILAIALGIVAAIQLYSYFAKFNHKYIKIYGLIISFSIFNIMMTMGLFYVFANLFPRFKSKTALIIELVYCLLTSIVIVIISYLYVLLYRHLLEHKNPDKYKKKFLGGLGGLSLLILYYSIYSISISKIWPISYLSIGFIIVGNSFNLAVLILLNIKSKNHSSWGKKRAIRGFSFLIIIPYGFAIMMFLSHILFDISNEIQNIFRFFFHLALLGSPIFLLKWFMKTYHGEIESDYPARTLQLKKLLLKYEISNREWEVIQLICKGQSNKEIEETLFISLQTVKDHVFSIYQKTGVKNRVQLNNLFRNSENQLFALNIENKSKS